MNSNILFGLMQPDLRSSIYEEIMQEKADKTKKSMFLMVILTQLEI